MPNPFYVCEHKAANPRTPYTISATEIAKGNAPEDTSMCEKCRAAHNKAEAQKNKRALPGGESAP